MDMMWYRRRGLMVTPHLEIVTGSIASFNSDYNKIRIKSLVCNINPIQEGSDVPSPENIRPISGRTGLSVVRTGKNLLPYTEQGAYKITDGLPILANSYVRSPKIIAKPNVTYWVSSSVASVACIFWDVNGNYISGSDYATIASRHWDAPINAHYVAFNFYSNTGNITPETVGNIMVNVGSGFAVYEPYKGTEVSVNWETEAGTVYGGYVDVVSGKLTVDRMYKELQNITQWQKSTAYPGGFYAKAENFAEDGHEIKKVTPFICTHAKTAMTLSEYVPGTCYMDTTVNLRLMSAETTIEQWVEYLDAQKTAGTPVSCCFYLANPYIVQLTPQEVKTFLVNNIWCDSGDVTVDYWKWGK